MTAKTIVERIVALSLLGLFFWAAVRRLKRMALLDTPYESSIYLSLGCVLQQLDEQINNFPLVTK
jgi:hypothetical protein